MERRKLPLPEKEAGSNDFEGLFDNAVLFAAVQLPTKTT